MAIATDFSINLSTRVIDYTGTIHGSATSDSYHKVIDFHRWLQGLADDETATPNDYMSIVFQSPSDRQGIDNIISMQNGYTITQLASEHLYDGSIIQNDGDDIWDSIVVLSGSGSDLDVQILQDGALVSNDFWNVQVSGETTKGLNPDAAAGISTQFLLKVRALGADTDGRRIVGMTRVYGKTYSEFKIVGTARGNNSLPLTFTPDLNNETASGTVSGYTDGISLANSGYTGLDVNDDSTDEYYYIEYDLSGTSTYTTAEAYEYWKYITRTGESATILGLAGEIFRGITHQAEFTAAPAPSAWTEGGTALSWGTGATAGTGQLLAYDTNNEYAYIQLLTGVAPGSGMSVTDSTNSATTVGAAVEQTVSTPFCGQSTGSAIIGSYGFGVTPTDLDTADKLFDLDGNGPLSPPNFATFSVNGLDTGGDVIIVGPRGYTMAYDGQAADLTVGETLTFTLPAGTAKLVDYIDNGATGFITIGPPLTGSVPTDDSTIAGATGDGIVNGTVSSTLDLGQYTVNASYTGATTTITVLETIDSDMPASGTIRVQTDGGVYERLTYSSYTGSIFTVTSHDFTSDNCTSGNNCFVSFIDKDAASDPETFTVIYDADRVVFIRVRDGGGTPKKQAETTGTVGTAGGSVNVSLQSDE